MPELKPKITQAGVIWWRRPLPSSFKACAIFG